LKKGLVGEEGWRDVIDNCSHGERREKKLNNPVMAVGKEIDKYMIIQSRHPAEVLLTSSKIRWKTNASKFPAK